jgi:uncharacterized coiled-coil protein SlyX
MRLFRRRPPVEQVVVEAQLDYRDAVIEGLRDALAERDQQIAVLRHQLAVALIPQYMAAGLRARRRLNTDQTAVLRGRR